MALLSITIPLSTPHCSHRTMCLGDQLNRHGYFNCFQRLGLESHVSWHHSEGLAAPPVWVHYTHTPNMEQSYKCCSSLNLSWCTLLFFFYRPGKPYTLRTFKIWCNICKRKCLLNGGRQNLVSPLYGTMLWGMVCSCVPLMIQQTTVVYLLRCLSCLQSFLRNFSNLPVQYNRTGTLL